VTTTQFFVYRRPIAWGAMIATLIWGAFAYDRMPQRQDPIVPARMGVVVAPYPGAKVAKVEQEVTRKIERKVTENPSVERVFSISRQGLSVVYVELFEDEKNDAVVWQDIRGKLASMTDLPRVGDRPVTPFLNKDFGETVAVMLTISSPPVSDLEIDLRARSIRQAVEQARAERPAEFRDRRCTGVLVYPNTVARSYVMRIGRTLLQRLTEMGIVRDGRVLEAPGTGCLDVQLLKSPLDLERGFREWKQQFIASGESHPDLWGEFFITDLDQLPTELRRAAKDKYTYRELQDMAETIQDHIKQYPTVGQVELIGTQNEQIKLFYSGQRFNQFGIRPADIIGRLRARNINLPGGKVELSDQSIVVQPSGEFRSEQEIGQVVVALAPDGYPLYLRDLVEITRGYVDPPDVMNFRTVKVDARRPKTGLLPTEQGDRAAGAGSPTDENHPTLPERYDLQTTRAITLSIRQVAGSHIADFGRDIDEALARLKGVLPDDLQVERTSNEPAQVKDKIRQFNHCLIEAVVIVIITALLLMEWRSAILVAVSIPVTIAMTLGMCRAVGIDLQQVSIAALIIALGLLVDDPVVASDAINREIAAGRPRHVAAWLGPTKLARAILFATLTNIVAYLPLLLVTGKVGNFIYSLPIVITASLVSSRIVSMTFMPLLGYYLLRGQHGFEASTASAGNPSRFANAYRRLAEWCIDHKAVSLTLLIVILGAGSALLTLIPTSFFPKDLHSTFTVNVFMPEGSPIRQTREETLRIVKKIDELEGKRIRAYTTFVGAGGPRFWLSVLPEQRADNYAQILVHTLDKRETADIVARLKAHLPPQVASARVTIEQLETGPPIGVPVQLRIYGEDIEELRRLATAVKRQLYAVAGADNIHDDWDPEVLQISLDIDPDRANITGVTNEDVAGTVYTGLSGYSATQLREKNHLIDVVLRLRSDERSQVNDLANINAVSTLTGARVPLLQIADFRTEMVSPKIRRREHERCLTVKCDAVRGVLPSQIVKALQKSLPTLAWPPGYRYEFGGEHHEQEKAFSAVRIALIVSLLAIYAALVWQFNSLIKPLVVLVAIPFGLVGGLMGLLVFGEPFGFVAFLGVASLAGVIVSHVIVLFDFIEEMREKGEPVRNAVIHAALARLRPVLVTVLATVGGLIPLAYKGGPLWKPMCYVQIVGLLVATVVTLVIVPIVLTLCVENLKIIKWNTHEEGPPPDLKI